MATKKKSKQKVHTVRAELIIPQLTKAGSSLELDVYAEGQKLGKLVLGRVTAVDRRQAPKQQTDLVEPVRRNDGRAGIWEPMMNAAEVQPASRRRASIILNL